MPRLQIRVEDSDHLLACLLRNPLFQEGASFASCIMSHPQDTFLTIEVESDSSPHLLLERAVHASERRLDQCLLDLSSQFSS